MSKRFTRHFYSSILRAISIDSVCCCLPAASVLSNKVDNSRSNQVLINKSPCISPGHTPRRNNEKCNTKVHGEHHIVIVGGKQSELMETKWGKHSWPLLDQLEKLERVCSDLAERSYT